MMKKGKVFMDVYRFISCPNKCDFLKSSVNVIDYVATISFYTDLFLQQHVSHIKNADVFEFFSIIRILRFKLAPSDLIKMIKGPSKFNLDQNDPPQAVQVDAALVRAEDPVANIPCLREGVDAPRLLPRPWHHHLCIFRLACR